MYNVSDLFKQYSSGQNRTFDVKVAVGDVEYLGSEVVEFSIVDSIVPDEDFTLGAAIASSLDVSIRTADSIATNAKITPYIRLNGDGGWTEWMPLGDFYIDSRKYQNSVWKFQCFDRLIYAQETYDSGLSYPAKMSDVVNEICSQLGVPLDGNTVVSNTLTIPIKPTGLTIREVLGGIAAVHCANVKIGKDGKLKFITCDPNAVPTAIGPADYVKAEQTNPVKTFTQIIGVYNQAGDEFIAGDTNSDADHTLTFYSPYVTKAILTSMFSTLNGFAYMPFTMNWKGFPYLEVGDAIQLTQRDNSTFKAVFLQNKISFKGGFKMDSEAPSSAANQSEFKFKGTIKQYVSDIADSIEQALLYYTNPNAITIGTTASQPVYLSVDATQDTNLKVYLAIFGVASVSNLVTIEIQVDNKDFIFAPKQQTQVGGTIIGIPFIVPQMAAGAHYFGIYMKTDTGTFTIAVNQLQVTLEGGHLLGGLSAAYPHAEHIDNVAYLNVYTAAGKTISDSNSAAVQVPLTPAKLETVSPIDVLSFGSVTGGHATEMQDFYEETDSNITYTGTWTSDSNSSYSANGTAKKTTSGSATMQFNFTGTSLALLLAKNSSNTNSIHVQIDTSSYFVSEYSTSTAYRQITQAIAGLEDKEHYVTISDAVDGTPCVIDGICLDVGKSLKPYNAGV